MADRVVAQLVGASVGPGCTWHPSATLAAACSQLDWHRSAASGRHSVAAPGTCAQLIVVSVLTAPSTFGSGGGGALAMAASAATFSFVTFSR